MKYGHSSSTHGDERCEKEHSVIMVYGMDVMYNEDDDGDTRDSKLIWSPSGTDSWNNPSLWATAKLAGTTAIDQPNNLPDQFTLNQNYPNPFNPTTNIEYTLNQDSHVKLVVYDLLGREVTTLVNNFQPRNIYTVAFDGTNFASGVYFYRLEIGSKVLTKKMVLLK